MADQREIITKIREHYESRGISLEALSDQEIAYGVMQLASAARESGVGSEGAEDAMRAAVEVAKKRAAEAQAAADAQAAAEEEAAAEDS